MSCNTCKQKVVQIKDVERKLGNKRYKNEYNEQQGEPFLKTIFEGVLKFLFGIFILFPIFCLILIPFLIYILYTLVFGKQANINITNMVDKVLKKRKEDE